MLLGVVIHAICAYSTFPNVWWFKDSQTGSLADVGILAIHIFRMPVFFVMAGFFAALLYARRGTGPLVRNRTQRILVPFVISMATLWPLLMAMQRLGDGWSWTRTWEWFSSGRALRYLHTGHLWFLWYLLIFYVLTVLAVVTLGRLDFSRPDRWFRRLLRCWWAPAVFAVPTFVSLTFMSVGILDTSNNLVPSPRILIAYAVFYLFGWGLYFNADLLEGFARNAWRSMGIGVVTGILLFPAIYRLFGALPKRELPLLMAVAAAGSLSAWFLIYGFIGLFLRYLNAPNPRLRYLSDSAYWIYLVHPVPVLAFHMALSGVAWNPVFKAALTLAASTVLLLASYQSFVRRTWIGVLLNGRRYEAEPREQKMVGEVARLYT